MENLQKNTKDGLIQIVKKERKWYKEKMKDKELYYEVLMENQWLRYKERNSKLKEKHRKKLETKDAEIKRLSEKNGEDRVAEIQNEATTSKNKENDNGSLNQVPDMLCSTTNECREVCGGGTKRKVEMNQQNPPYRIPKKRKEYHPDDVRERKILEGITKFVLQKICPTNFFRSYEDWFNWIKEIRVTNTITFQNGYYLFMKCVHTKVIHFTNGKKFPLISNDELVLPVTKEGWNINNTRCFVASQFRFKKLKSPFITEKNLGPGYFKMTLTQDHRSNSTDSHSSFVLVFMRVQ